MSEPRQIEISFLKIKTEELCAWLQANNIKYTLTLADQEFTIDPNKTQRITPTYILEVYSASHETAIRIKWDVEKS